MGKKEVTQGPHSRVERHKRKKKKKKKARCDGFCLIGSLFFFKPCFPLTLPQFSRKNCRRKKLDASSSPGALGDFHRSVKLAGCKPDVARDTTVPLCAVCIISMSSVGNVKLG